MNVQPCLYRHKSPEAYRISAKAPPERKTAEPITVMLCTWPKTIQGNKPEWFKKAVGDGLSIRPEHDCIRCLARVAPTLTKETK